MIAFHTTTYSVLKTIFVKLNTHMMRGKAYKASRVAGIELRAPGLSLQWSTTGLRLSDNHQPSHISLA